MLFWRVPWFRMIFIVQWAPNPYSNYEGPYVSAGMR